MYDRSSINFQSSSSSSSKTASPPWRYTEIPVELFDLMTASPCTSIRLYRLHYEILQFYHFMIPTEEENAVRQQVIDRICAVIHQNLPTASVDIYGSHKTRLNLPMSDIDLIVYSAHGHQWDAEELVEIMSDLRNAFCHHQICTEEEIQVLNRATVPIIKLTDRRTDVRVDMSFNMNGGPRSTQLILHYLNAYPYLKYLLYVLKQYLFQLDLNTVWTGGISSYSLILMLVCFFQAYYKKFPDSLDSSASFLLSQSTSSSGAKKTILSPTSKTNSHGMVVIDDGSSSASCPSSSAASCISSDDPNNGSNPSSDNDDEQHHSIPDRTCHPTNVSPDHINLGHMLLSFLQLYGVYFDYAKLGIRVQKPHQPDSSAGFIDKEELFKNFCCGHRTMTNLCIVDPFNDTNDIGKATWLIPQLQIAFRQAFEILSPSVSDRNTVSNNAPPILSKILTINDRIIAYREQLHRIYGTYQKEQRLKQMQFEQSFLTERAFIEYSNGIPLRYASHMPYQQAFLNHVPPLHSTRLKSTKQHHRKIQP